jgi:uncharacterized protein YbbC (DUF1343 family)
MHLLSKIIGSTLVLLSIQQTVAQVTVGADVLIRDRLDLVKGRRVAVVTNQTARLSTGEHLISALRENGVDVVLLFGPEHGIRGFAAAGERVRDSSDVVTGIPVISLYGRVNKPTPEMLRNIDVLLYDIQDVGTRFYTFISTMVLAMEASAEQNIPFIVLDRPNPLGGNLVDGPVLEDSLRSFVGMLKVPVVYGMTCGELARFVNGEGMLAGGIKVKLTVVPLEGWSRQMLWRDTGLPWIPPSPNMPSPEAAMVYPATCFFEATNLSEGRGTSRPFHIVGAPFIDAIRLAKRLNSLALKGVQFDTVTFVPTSSKQEGRICRGISLNVTDPTRFERVRTGLVLLREVGRLYRGSLALDRRWFVKLMGSQKTYEGLIRGTSVDSIVAAWKSKVDRFKEVRKNYLLYGSDG